MLNYKPKRINSCNSIIVLLITFAVIQMVDSQYTNFQIVSDKNVTDQDCGPFLKISARVIDKLLCLSYCPKVDCNLVSFDTNNNQCRIYNISSNVLQQTGLTFSNTPGINLYFSKPFVSKTFSFNGSLKSSFSIHSSRINSAIKLSTGDFASGSFDYSIKFFNLDGTVKRTILPNSGWITVLREIPNGKLVSGSYSGVIHIWSIYDGSSVRNLTGHSLWIMSLLYIPSISRLASGANDNTIKIWDPSNGVLYTTLTSHTSFVNLLVLLPNGDMASGSGDNYIKIWDVTNFSVKKNLYYESSAINAMIVLKNGNVALGYTNNKIIIWQYSDGIINKTLIGTNAVYSLAQLVNGDLASGGIDNTILIWDLNTGLIKMILNRHLGSVVVLLSLDSGELLSCSTDNNVFVWI